MNGTLYRTLLLAAVAGLESQAAPLLSVQQFEGDTHASHFLMKTGSNAGSFQRGNTSTQSTSLSCGVTSKVGSSTNKYELCPVDCPFFAQNRLDSEYCTFLCVPGDECPKWNPQKPIPDTIKNSRTCRGPIAKFCTELNTDGTDSCKTCQSGFQVWLVDGQCYFAHWTALIIVTLIVVVLLTVLTVWFVDWCTRSGVNNEAAVEKGITHRSRAKIVTFKTPGQRRQPHDGDTNLCTTEVAGPGMLLHFNFQAFFIMWPLVLAMVWTVLFLFYPQLRILGTRKFGTPRHNCILVAWGYETQHRLMWTKNLFLLIAYLFSFVTFLLFSVRQLRIFQRSYASKKTMQNFAVELRGLPQMPGSDPNVEKTIQKAVEDANQNNAVKVVGVSVCWTYMDKVDQVMGYVQAEQVKAEIDAGSYEPPPEGDDPTANLNTMQKKFYAFEKWALGYSETEPEKKDVTEFLGELKSSESAFVVFESDDGRKAALRNTLSLTYKEKEYPLTLHVVHSEPATVNFHNFGDTSHHAMMWRFFKALGAYYVPALTIWFVFFYVPYAVSLYYFNYDNGAELPAFYSIIFTMVVVGGNATMYVICDIIGDKIGFKYKDTKQTTYMILYLVACMVNVVLDMAVTYRTALKIMRGLDFRNYYGTRLEEITTFTEQFETYAMQRSLGANTFAYSFPSTFLIPFILEPIVTILVPYQLGRLIVRTHQEVQGADAEAFLVAFDFDLGRYADILLNVFLGILIFWFPGGYIWGLFYGMCFSHIVIYTFDHWRVLNVIPNVQIVNMQVDWWAQVMMVGCCGMILSCLVFKMNCESYAGYCMQGTKLIQVCTLAGIAHCVVHMLLLLYLVPALGIKEDDKIDASAEPEQVPTDVPKEPENQYKAYAEIEPRTWFSSNPVHCLRSQFVHKKEPFCRFAAVGKEHLLQVNEEIGCFFSDEPAETEDYSVHHVVNKVSEASHRLKRRGSEIVSKLKSDSSRENSEVVLAPK